MTSKIIYISKLGILVERVVKALFLPEIRHEQMSLSGQNNCVVRVVHKTGDRDEIISSSALRNESSAMARVEIWHAKNMRDFSWSAAQEGIKDVKKSDYSLAGILVLPDNKDVLNSAYDNSNNMEDAWNPLKSTRSSMVGDIFVVHHADGKIQTVSVASIGFSPAQFND